MPERKDKLADVAEAVSLNETAKRQAPSGWSALKEIKKWREERIRSRRFGS